MAHHYDGPGEDDAPKKVIKNTKNSYNKEFTYEQYKFNMKVELDAIIERRVNGKRLHKVICNEMGHSNYYRTYEAEGLRDLKNVVIQAENDAMRWADERGAPLSETEVFLTENGFE